MQEEEGDGLGKHSREDANFNKELNSQLLFQFNKGSYSSQRLKLRSPQQLLLYRDNNRTSRRKSDQVKSKD